MLREVECQPILFVGAGLSRRYFGAPGWHDALANALSAITDDGPAYEYYAQKHGDDLPKIGSLIAARIHEWAWSKGKNVFPKELFEKNRPTSVFLKQIISKQLSDITPKNPGQIDKKFADEISNLLKIRAHAIITTNYDKFLENLFQGYAPIIGQEVIRYDVNSFGEIFKIHGTVEQPSSLIITEEDYDFFSKRQKYISAKLLTYFAEHPVFIFGYSFNDPNISSIIADLGEIIADSDGLISNIYYIAWDPLASSKAHLQSEHIVSSGGRQYRVKAIVTDDFNWIYTAISSDAALKSINPKLVRALAARTFRLIRSDIPRGKFEVNYQILEGLTESDDNLPNILGITRSSNANESHSFSISQIAEQLGYKYWSPVDRMIKSIERKTGINLRASDNRYYIKIKTGKKSTSFAGKWSHEALALFRKIKNNEPYEINL